MNNAGLPLIDDIAVIRLAGPDAEAFAQAQTMNDVAALPVGHWHWNGWLTPKGRVQALFALARVAPGDLLVLLLDHPAEAFRDALQRFVFRSKVRITVESGLGLRGEWPGDASPDGASKQPEARAESATFLRRPDGTLGLDFSATSGPRFGWIAARGDAGPDADASARWRDEDLRHGLPRFGAGREHGWTPHMLSLDRLKAFSVRKGCYPGQEIVARTHYLGQSKRQAWWLDGAGLAAGLAVADLEGRPVGEVVEASADGRGALAVAALPGPGEVKSGEGIAMACAPREGLARPIEEKL